MHDVADSVLDSTLEVLEPSGGKLREKELDGINKGRFEVTEGERGRMGVSTNLGADMNRRKATNSVDVNVMVDVCTERGNKGSGVGFKIGDTGEKTKEVPFYIFFLWNPMFFSTVVNDRVLVGMTVNSKSTSRSLKKVRVKVG